MIEVNRADVVQNAVMTNGYPNHSQQTFDLMAPARFS
jgi:hypothetical protein